MDRTAVIQAIKAALDAGQLATVRELAAEAPADVAARALAAAGRARGVQPGYYTVVLADGHVTFRVKRQAPGANFAPGELVVARLRGPQNDADYTGVAFIKEGGVLVVWKKFRDDARLRAALDVLVGDPRAAALGYAQAAGCCYVCGRLLTTPESIDSGIGPVCAEKGGY